MLQFFLVTGGERTRLGFDPAPVVNENDPAFFELRLDGDEISSSWRIRLGDVLPDNPGGDDFDIAVRWRRTTWFDCCRGSVTVSLEQNLDLAASVHDASGWTLAERATVLVRPAKLTDDEWMAMRADLESVAVDLANTLVGKASEGQKRAARARTPLDDLVAARQLLSRLDLAVDAIALQPHAVLRVEPNGTLGSPRRLDAVTLKRLLARGADPRSFSRAAPVRVPGRRTVGSFDIPEHRQILGTLREAEHTLLKGEKRALTEIEEVLADKPWRERHDDLPGTSLFERFDYPRIQRLRELLRESVRLRKWASRIASAPVFAGLRPDGHLQASSITRFRPPYSLALRAALAWRMEGRVQIDTGALIRVKDTDRMYEQWVFLQLAAGLRALGYEMKQGKEVYRKISARRYVTDLPRGARLSFDEPTGTTIELYYEPWIRPRESAVRAGDLFFHGKGRAAAWSPDILMTVRTVSELNSQIIVFDAKYTRQVREEHWSGVRKYLQIRRLSDDGFPVRQVWLAAPGAVGITTEDDSIKWNEDGVNFPGGVINVQGTIGLSPTCDRTPGEPVPTVVEFLSGLLSLRSILSSNMH